MQDRMMTLLRKGACRVRQASHDTMTLQGTGGATLSVHRDELRDLLSRGVADLKGSTLRLAGSQDRTMAKQSSSPEESVCHRDLSCETVVVDGEVQTALVNHNESPLAALARRRDRAGRPFLDARLVRAGERLRVDYTRAMILPRLGANWEAHVASGRRDGGGGSADLTDAVLAAKLRVEQAIDAVGPELAGVLIDVCCFLKGLELVEAERGWPVRSAKIILKAGLSALSRYYEPESGSRRPRVIHWGSADYRPTING